MALDTWTNLQAAIADWLWRTDLTANIPDFIALAEAQMLTRIKTAWVRDGTPLPRSMVTRNAAFGIAAEFVSVPVDFIGPVALTIDSEAVELSYLSPENFTLAKSRRGTSPASDTPIAYTIIGNQFQFLPAPDAAYMGTLIYWQVFTALSGSNASNWILANHPDAYLYGALTQAAPMLREDDRLGMWAKLFENAIADLIVSDPTPNDMMTLRVDYAILFPIWGHNFLDITSGGFP